MLRQGSSTGPGRVSHTASSSSYSWKNAWGGGFCRRGALYFSSCLPLPGPGRLLVLCAVVLQRGRPQRSTAARVATTSAVVAAFFAGSSGTVLPLRSIRKGDANKQYGHAWYRQPVVGCWLLVVGCLVLCVVFVLCVVCCVLCVVCCVLCCVVLCCVLCSCVVCVFRCFAVSLFFNACDLRTHLAPDEPELPPAISDTLIAAGRSSSDAISASSVALLVLWGRL